MEQDVTPTIAQKQQEQRVDCRKYTLRSRSSLKSTRSTLKCMASTTHFALLASTKLLPLQSSVQVTFLFLSFAFPSSFPSHLFPFANQIIKEWRTEEHQSEYQPGLQPQGRVTMRTVDQPPTSTLMWSPTVLLRPHV